MPKTRSEWLKSPTFRQLMIHGYMLGFQATHGYPPSVREIGEDLGIRNPNSVRGHLAALIRKGLATRSGKGLARNTLAVRPDAPSCCPTCGRPLEKPAE